MTVAELIAKLKEQDPEAEVWLNYWTGMAGMEPAVDVEVDERTERVVITG